MSRKNFGADRDMMVESTEWHSPKPTRSGSWTTKSRCQFKVNGKVKAGLKVDVDISEEDIKKLALADEGIAALIEGKELKKFLCIPSRMVTIAAKRQPAEALSLGTQLVPFVKALSRRYHGRPALRKRRPQVWARNISPT